MTTPRPLRIAHLADTHLGYRAIGRIDPKTGRNQRSVDVEAAFIGAVDRILAADVDLVLHAGDVFHHTRPSWSALSCFVRQMRRIEAAGLPCVVIAGNHDTPRLRTTGSVFGLLELALPDVTFIAGYAVGEIAFDELDLTVVAVPHGALTNPDPPAAWPIPGRRTLLITHGLAPGVTIRGRRPELGEEELDASLLDADYAYVALGHYHQWGSQGNNAWYSGSTERTGWGDEETTPGFALVELADPAAGPSVTHIPLPARPMRTLTPLDGDGRNARELADIVLDRLRAYDEPTAMTRVQLLHTPRPVRREVESILRREATDLVWSIQIFSPADVLAGFDGDESEHLLPNVQTLFDDFVTERVNQGAYEAGFADAFRARGASALAHAVQAVETASGEDASG